MPKRSGTTLQELEQLLWQPGNRWKNRGHLFSVFIFGGIFQMNFNSTRNALIYGMYMSNWIEISPERPHKSITIEEIADTIDKYLPDIAQDEAIYNFFGTSRNTFKNKYARFLKLPKNPTIGNVIIAMDKWTDRKWQILRPITKKDIASLEGLYHKKISHQINEVPQVIEFLEKSHLSYKEIKGFPPYLVEQYFEEIGEPEKYEELVANLNK